MISNYQDPANRIKELIAYGRNETTTPKTSHKVNAFTLDTALISFVVKHQDTVKALRVYFAKHKKGKPEEQTYTLVVIPVNKNGDNIFLKTITKNGTSQDAIFEWNDHCPPYCPGSGMMLPIVRTDNRLK